MNDEHVFALVEAIDGANLHAIHKLALDAGFIDDIGQVSSSLSAMITYSGFPPHTYFIISGQLLATRPVLVIELLS
jgi:hypothetical protein